MRIKTERSAVQPTFYSQFTMNALTIAAFALLAIQHFGAASEEQQPQLTRCSVGTKSFIKIVNVTVGYKRTAKKVTLNVALRVNKTFGSSPALEIYTSAVNENTQSCNLTASPE
ncbi:hypothetical protein MTO96_023120 [Rhipicephalus appendiculatus]